MDASNLSKNPVNLSIFLENWIIFILIVILKSMSTPPRFTVIKPERGIAVFTLAPSPDSMIKPPLLAADSDTSRKWRDDGNCGEVRGLNAGEEVGMCSCHKRRSYHSLRVGLSPVNQMMDSVEYRRESGCNVLIMRKETHEALEAEADVAPDPDPESRFAFRARVSPENLT